MPRETGVDDSAGTGYSRDSEPTVSVTGPGFVIGVAVVRLTTISDSLCLPQAAPIASAATAATRIA